MKKALIVAGKFIQDVEFTYPYYRLQEAGFGVDVAVRGRETVYGVIGQKIVPTLDVPEVVVDNYELIIVPGGARAMEYMRQDQDILRIIQEFYDKGKVVAAICHGTQLLISAKIVKDKKISGYYSIKDDIENAGAKYIDAPAVVDGTIVTSPHYKHLGDWMREVLKLVHAS